MNFEDDMELALGYGDGLVVAQDCDFDGEIFADGEAGDDELDLRGDNTFDLSEPRVVRDFEDLD